jgi:hypothetical protein
MFVETFNSMHYLIKVKFDTGEVTKSGTPKTRDEQYLVEDVAPEGAIARASENLSDSVETYEIVSVVATKIREVFLTESTLKFLSGTK